MSATRRLRTALLGAVSAMALALPSVAIAGGADQVDLMVRPATTVEAVAADVDRLGGTVAQVLGAVGLLEVTVPARAVAALEDDEDVAGIARTTAIGFADADDDDRARTGVAMSLVNESIEADEYHEDGYDGSGIDIAVIDTGIADVPELAGKVVKGPDLSFDSGNPARELTDGYGHGTHLAAIMAGHGNVDGVAPGARLVDVRVGDHNGLADVSQVIAAIDWVIQNAHTDGRNIRVLNLAFGTPSTQAWTIDPLAYAVEAAWRNGIVVVASAGNGGAGTSGLSNPATHPMIIAVGATDTLGTGSNKDDVLTSFTQAGSTRRGPDLVAPGRSILSVVPAASTLAEAHPEANRGSLFVGSGTSQASAVTAGAVALLLERHPGLTPDEVKAALRNTARDLQNGEIRDGAGRLRVGKTFEGAGGAYGAVQNVGSSDGTGSLEASRGGRHVQLVMANGEIRVLEGERTYTFGEWKSGAWAGSNWEGSNWEGSNWEGSNWEGSNWEGSNWEGSNWEGSNWEGSNWEGSNWEGSNWEGSNWETAIWGS